MPVVRLVIDETAYVRPRHLRPGPAVVVGTSVGARAAEARKKVPAELLACFDKLMAELEPAVALVQGAIAPRGQDEEAPAPEPGPELLELEPLEVLTRKHTLNHAIDEWVGAFETSLAGALKRPASDPKGRAARLLQQSFFAEGKRFLTFTNQEQWLAVHQRFNEINADERAAAATLAIDDMADSIAALNAFFGRILGITEAEFSDDTDEPEQERRRSALAALLELLSRCIHFANLAWPGPDAAAGEARVAMVGPLTERFFEDAAERAKKQAVDGPPSE